MDTVYLDIRKAFDSVLHKDLLTKIWSVVIHGSLWYNAYLTMCLYQQFYLRSAARAIWGTPGQHSQSTFIFSLQGRSQL